MQPYGIPTNQYELYSASVHGKALLEEQDLRVPPAPPATARTTRSHPRQVVQALPQVPHHLYSTHQESKHSRLAVGPKCWTCHGNHDVAQPGPVAVLPSDGHRLRLHDLPQPVGPDAHPQPPTNCARMSIGGATPAHHSASQI